MTKKIARIFFRSYHLLFVSKNANCRFTPTCSRYALEAIEKYGALKGSFMAIKRLLSCHPFSSRPYYDPA